MYYHFENLRYEEQKISLFPYYPRHSNRRNEITQKILDFKENHNLAVHWFQQCAEQALSYSELDFLDMAPLWYLFAIPGSTAGTANTPCERVCTHLDAAFSWLWHLPHVLERTQTVPKSATARKENRPRTSRETHQKTIRYTGPQLSPRSGILLVDDVLTTANTFHACRDILRKATACEHIFGLFMGRTQLV
jgi:hypothetical protein